MRKAVIHLFSGSPREGWISLSAIFFFHRFNLTEGEPAQDRQAPALHGGLMQAQLLGQSVRQISRRDTHARIDGWRQWAQERKGGENSLTAFRKMVKCHKQGGATLAAGENGLRRIPPRRHITLNLKDMELTSFPPREPDVHRLLLDENPITDMSSLSSSTIRFLSLGECDNLERLPPQCPAGLERLYISGADNLVELPWKSPVTLRHVRITCSGLERLPEFAEGLETLEVQANFIEALPERLPRTLRRLDFSHNCAEIDRLPENIFTDLRRNCVIDLTGNILSPELIADLDRRMNRQDYNGPRIHYSVQANARKGPERSLNEVIAGLPDMSADELEQWRSFETEPRAKNFADFLGKLLEVIDEEKLTVSSKKICDWLRKLAANPKLREESFIVSEDQTATCGDRLLLAFNDMKKLELAADVERGAYDNRLEELVETARSMFRLDELIQIARRKAQSMNFVDEIEVHLAYIVKLREALNLPLDVAEMLYEKVSNVKDSDLEKALQEVKEQEVKSFTQYLVNDWAPWKSVMQRLDPEGFQKNEEARQAFITDKLVEFVDKRLEKEGLKGNYDAEVRTAANLTADISKDFNLTFAREVLARHGKPDLI